MNDEACETPLADLRQSALDHYDKLATAGHEWSSFVVNAIKAYDPNTLNADRLAAADRVIRLLAPMHDESESPSLNERVEANRAMVEYLIRYRAYVSPTTTEEG